MFQKWTKKFANVEATIGQHSISAVTRCQRQVIKKRHMINRHASKMDKEICKCGGNYGPPFDQCRDTLPAATYKETAYDQSSCFKNGQRNLQMWGQLRSTIPSVP